MNKIIFSGEILEFRRQFVSAHKYFTRHKNINFTKGKMQLSDKKESEEEPPRKKKRLTKSGATKFTFDKIS